MDQPQAGLIGVTCHITGHDHTVGPGMVDRPQQVFIVPAIDDTMEIGQVSDPKALKRCRELLRSDGIVECLEHNGERILS